MKPDIRAADRPKPNEHVGHRERMRARIMKDGVDSLAEHEVLEVLLYAVVPRRDTNHIAHQLLNRFGSLANVLDASPIDLQKQTGIGAKAAFHLHYTALAAACYIQSKNRQRLIYGSTQAFLNHVRALFPAEVCEVAYMLCLDNSMRLINTVKLAKGTRDSVNFSVSELVRLAVSHGAKNVVLAHNHPSGRLKPSDDDLQLTRQCMLALALVHIKLHDHLIICGQRYLSFAEHGYMKAIYQNEQTKNELLKAAENILSSIQSNQA